MDNERKSNIEVTVIDGIALGKKMREMMGNKLSPEATLNTHYTYGYIKTPKGTFIVDSEGTGHSLPIEEAPSTLDFSRHDIMTCMPTCSLNISEDVNDVPILEEKVNLADFIRSFGDSGSRLSCNFKAWNKFLTDKMKETND